MPTSSLRNATVAKFNPLVRTYIVLYVAFILLLTVVGIPLAIIWILGVGQWYARHYYDKLSCELDEKELRFRKGILFQIEKTIPLENIQDVTFIEGPLLKYFHLSILKFETAGQSMGQAHDMSLVGIVDAQQFRDQILLRRTEAKKRQTQNLSNTSNADENRAEQTALLRDIATKLNTLIELTRNKS